MYLPYHINLVMSRQNSYGSPVGFDSTIFSSIIYESMKFKLNHFLFIRPVFVQFKEKSKSQKTNHVRGDRHLLSPSHDVVIIKKVN